MKTKRGKKGNPTKKLISSTGSSLANKTVLQGITYEQTTWKLATTC